MPTYLAKHYFWVCLSVCFWKTLAFELMGWVEQIALPSVGGHDSTYWGPILDYKMAGGWILSTWLIELRHGSSTLGLGLRPSNSDWNYSRGSPALKSLNYTTGFLNFQLAEGRLWDCSASIHVWANSLYISLIDVGSVSSQENSGQYTHLIHDFI